MTIIEAATGKPPYADEFQLINIYLFLILNSRAEGSIKFWDFNEVVMSKPAPKLPAGYSADL